jgi:hypothetical protein
MSDVINVKIVGVLPFNFRDRNDIFKEMLSVMNTPSWGIKIKYDGMNTFCVPNENGGITVWYPFEISGAEAISFITLGRWIDELINVGIIHTAYYQLLPYGIWVRCVNKNTKEY